jgi:hypothetical protein
MKSFRTGTHLTLAAPPAEIARRNCDQHLQAPEPIARGSEALAFHPLAQQLAVPAHRLGFLAGAALGWFFEGAAELHFAEDALPLHFFLQDAKRLIDIVVTDDDLHETPLLWAKKNGPQNRSRPKES